MAQQVALAEHPTSGGGGGGPCPEGMRRNSQGVCVKMAEHHHDDVNDDRLAVHPDDEEKLADHPDDELKLQDGKFIIEDRVDHFIFETINLTGKELTRTNVGRGVTAIGLSSTARVGAFKFEKSAWQFAEVHAWLTERGFQPSDIQSAKFEMEPNLHIVMLETKHDTEIKQVALAKDEKGAELVVIEAVAVTPGLHDGFQISRAVLERAVTNKKYENVRIVINHKFDQPSSVVGFGTNVKMEKDDPGPIVRASIFDPVAKRAVKDGILHSVSSNFLLFTRPHT